MQLCNPTISVCTPQSNYSDLLRHALEIGLNQAQLATAGRLAVANEYAASYYSVFSLGPSGNFISPLRFNWLMDVETALLAQESVFYGSSIGLPQNQWQLEVRRWFETSLAKMQASFVEFVANDVDGSYITVNSIKDNTSDPLEKDLFQQCYSQRIQATSSVQNFCLLGILVVICIRIFLIGLSLVLDSCVSFFFLESGKYENWTDAPASQRGRQ
jgi:hypothetical protein